MPDIHIHRAHRLGLPKARQIASQWAADAQDKFDMVCTLVPGDEVDTVTFTRVGVNGTLRVAADHFELNAKLGFLLGAFSKTIESQIEKNLDDLLSSGARAAARAKREAKKPPPTPRPPK